MPVYPCLLVPLAVRLSPIDRPVNMEYLTYATISRSAVRTKATETDTDELVQVLTGKNYLRICPHCLFSFLWTWRPLKASREDRFHSVALWEKTCWKNLQRAEDVHMSGGVSCPHSRTPPPLLRFPPLTDLLPHLHWDILRFSRCLDGCLPCSSFFFFFFGCLSGALLPFPRSHLSRFSSCSHPPSPSYLLLSLQCLPSWSCRFFHFFFICISEMKTNVLHICRCVI